MASALGKIIGQPEYDPKKYKTMQEYVDAVNAHTANFEIDKTGAINNTRTGETVGFQNRKSEPNKVTVTGYSGVRQPPNTVVSSGASNANNYIDQLTNARRQQQMAQLDKSKNAALSNLSAEKSKVSPAYYDKRNQVAAGSQQASRSLAEFMASRGGTRSGAAAQAEISRQGALQSNIGSLNRQEQATLDDIARRSTGVRNAYESDRTALEAGLQAARMEALINQMNQERSFGLQEDRFGLQQQGQQFQQQQAEIDNAFRQQQFDHAKAADLWERTFKERSFDQSVKEAAANRGLDWSRLNQQEQQFIADTAFREKQLGLDQARLDFQKQQVDDESNNDFSSEITGLTSGIQNGQIDYNGALTEIQYGNYTPEQKQLLTQAAKETTVRTIVSQYASAIQQGGSPMEALIDVRSKENIGTIQPDIANAVVAEINRLYPNTSAAKEAKQQQDYINSLPRG